MADSLDKAIRDDIKGRARGDRDWEATARSAVAYAEAILAVLDLFGGEDEDVLHAIADALGVRGQT